MAPCFFLRVGDVRGRGCRLGVVGGREGVTQRLKVKGGELDGQILGMIFRSNKA